jgi:hypothetical protein
MLKKIWVGTLHSSGNLNTEVLRAVIFYSLKKVRKIFGFLTHFS